MMWACTLSFPTLGHLHASMAPTKAKGGATAPSRKNVVFVHPDLGIGGAERLIIDAAVGLQELGHKVTIFTSHCDPRHCFEEARDGMFCRLFCLSVIGAKR